MPQPNRVPRRHPRGPRRRSVSRRQVLRVLEMTRSLSSTLQPERVLAQVVDQVRAILQVEACAIYRVHQDTLVACAWSPSELANPPDLALDQGVVGPAARAGRILLWNGEGAVPPGFASVLVLPMVVRARTVGSIHLYARTEVHVAESELSLLSDLAELAAVSLENSQLYHERDRVTRLLQLTLIPERLSHPEFSVAYRHFPSETLSGDYLDLFSPRPRVVTAVLADVAGKGPEAGIHTVRVKYIVRSLAQRGLGPADLLLDLNRQLLESEAQTPMVTLVYLEIDLDSRRLRLARAGHECPFWWSPDLPPSCPAYELSPFGMLSGAVPDVAYEEIELSLLPGASLLLYTDGLSEARDREGRFFGSEAVGACFQETCLEGPEVVVRSLVSRVQAFSHGRLRDDLTVMCLTF